MSFDHAAHTYDEDFTHTQIGEWLRRRVWHRFDQHLSAGQHVLELGCGTGEDAHYLTQSGLHVTATDASAEMLRITHAKANPAATAIFDLNDPKTWTIDGTFDGVISNFGALNCTHRLDELSHWLAAHTKPGAYIGLGMMSRVCLWEVAWHALHGDWRTATRRWQKNPTATLEDGTHFPVYYPRVRDVERAFAPHFRRIGLLGLGVFLPPSDVYSMVAARPRLHSALTGLETRMAAWPVWRTWGDHYWIEMERQ